MKNTNNSPIAGVRGGLTEADIFAAADEIYATGKRPTQVFIREKLGGGSFATIGPALKKWRAQQQECKDVENKDLPLELNAFLQQMGAKIWKDALTKAEFRLASESESLSQSLLQKDLELSNHKDELQKLATENQLYEKLISEQNAIIEDLTIQLRHLEYELIYP